MQAPPPDPALSFLYQQFLPILIGWSVVFIAAATIALWRRDTARFWRSFWFMSALWCVVNIAIAITALVGPPASAEEFRSLLGVNIVLNTVWIASGIALRLFPVKDNRTNTMLNGFGVAIIVQGLALLAFDTGWYVTLGQ